MYWISVLLGPDSFSFSHGWSRIITGLFFMSRIIELSNFSFHTECHGISRIYISCPELSNYRIFLFHTECHGVHTDYSCHELSNYRISFHTEFHGESRIYFFVMNSLIRKFGIKKNIRDIPWHSVWKERTVILRGNPCDENNSGTRVMMGYSAAE